MEDSEISSFFNNKCVFITRGTGYMGKVLLEKLLRSCSGLGKIYLLIRPKRGVSPKDRFATLASSPIFEKIREIDEHLLDKLELIYGDVSTKGLGIGETDHKVITETVSVVFHVAASVRFDQPLTEACRMNLGGTRNILDLCHKMVNLQSMVYVSTAYGNCDRKDIEEIVYPSNVDPDNLLKYLDLLDADFINKMEDRFLEGKPNTYVYTKFLAEKMIMKEEGNLPVDIVRPSIVTPSWREPFSGWLDSLYGPMGLTIFAGQGLLRVSRIHPNKIADFIPVDICINLIIVSAWNTATKKSMNLVVYNCVSGNRNPVTWADFLFWFEHFQDKNPLLSMVYVPGVIPVANKYLYKCLDFILHNIPARIMDLIAKMQGRPQSMYRFYDKLSYAAVALHFFTLNEWNFSDENVCQLHNSLSPIDQERFCFDVKTIDWVKYAEWNIIGGKKFILNEQPEDLPRAKRRYKRLMILHRIVQTILLFILYIFLRYLWELVLINRY